MKNFHTCHQKSRSDGDGLRGFTIEDMITKVGYDKGSIILAMKPTQITTRQLLTKYIPTFFWQKQIKYF